MKCKIPNQESGSSRIYIGAAMSDHYKPPGKEVQEDNGVRYITVQEDVGKVLVETHGFETFEESSSEESESKEEANE